MMGQTYAVHGATSTLGQRIVAALRADADTRLIVTDRLGSGAMRVAVRDADAVINTTMGSPAAISSGAARLFSALREEAPLKRLIHVSSMTVYGNATGLCNERTAPVGPLSEYAAAHLAAETAAKRFDQALILRPGVEYGPDCEAWSGRVASWLMHRRIGDLGAGGDGYCNLVFIEDLVRAVLAGIRSPGAPIGVFNVAMGHYPTWNEYLIAFAIALGATPVRRMTRRRWGFETRFLAAPLKVAERSIGRVPFVARLLPPAIPPSFRRLCTQEIRLDVTATEKALGLRWTPLEAGLAAAASAYGAGTRDAARAKAV